MSNPIPEGWSDTSIGELTKNNSLFSDGDWVESKDQDPKGENRLIQLADIGDGRFINKSSRYLNDEQFKRLKCTKLEKGDILIARMPEPLGRACIYPLDNVCAATIVDIAIIRTHNADHRWLMSAINSADYRTAIELNASGTTRTRIARGALSKLRLIAPPLPEQQKIAAILTSVDEVIEKTQAQIDKLKDLKTAMMQTLLTNGVGTKQASADGESYIPHTEFKDSPVGRIPNSWEVKSLSQVCTSKYAIVDGPFGSNLKTEHYRPTGIPVFQSGFVTSNKFVKKKYVFVDQSKYDEQIRSSAGPNDILMAKIGMNAGACAIIPIAHPTGILAGNSLKITVDRDVVLNDYVLGLLHFMQDTGDIRRLLTETAQPAISITTLKKMCIPIPPISEQRHIVNLLVVIDLRIDLIYQKNVAQLKLKKALMQDLLTGKVRVKVD